MINGHDTTDCCEYTTARPHRNKARELRQKVGGRTLCPPGHACPAYSGHAVPGPSKPCRVHPSRAGYIQARPSNATNCRWGLDQPCLTTYTRLSPPGPPPPPVLPCTYFLRVFSPTYMIYNVLETWPKNYNQVNLGPTRPSRIPSDHLGFHQTISGWDRPFQKLHQNISRFSRLTQVPPDQLRIHQTISGSSRPSQDPWDHLRIHQIISGSIRPSQDSQHHIRIHQTISGYTRSSQDTPDHLRFLQITDQLRLHQISSGSSRPSQDPPDHLRIHQTISGTTRPSQNPQNHPRIIQTISESTRPFQCLHTRPS